MSEAAKSIGKADFTEWSDSWLKSAGCNVIWHDIEEANGVITKFTVNQKIYKHGEGNRLRKQKYQVAFYNEDMKITKVVDVQTFDDREQFELNELVGQEAAYAYHINYRNYGYAKFKIDQKSLLVF